MGIIAAWNVLFGADNTQFKKVMADSRKETAKTSNTFKGFIKSLKSDFGKSSALGQSLKLIAGGGAIGALSMAGSKLKDFTGEMLELQKAFKAGTLSSAEFFEKIARGAPVFGGFFAAGRNVREFFTGQVAAQEKLDKAFADAQKRAEAFRETIARLKTTSDASRASFKEMGDAAMRSLTLARTPAGGPREFLRITMDADKQKDKIRDAIADVQKQLDAANKKNIDQRAQLLAGHNIPAAEVNENNDLIDNLYAMRAKLTKEGNDAIFKINREAAQDRADAVAEENAGYAKQYADMWDKLKMGAAQTGAAIVGQLTKTPEKINIKRIQLPGPATAAEDVFGKRTVSGADVPQPLVELNKTAKEQLAETKKTNAALAKRPADVGRAVIKIVTGW